MAESFSPVFSFHRIAGLILPLEPTRSARRYVAGVQMLKTVLMSLSLAVCGALLMGCQNEQGAGALPPLHLGPPMIAQASVVPPPPSTAPRPVPARTVIAARPVTPAPVKRHVAPPPVPAGWIPPVKANQWTWIIVHHSDSDYGSAAIIDQWHRARGFDELGYHFVIGNGTRSGDGEIEVGGRWTKQKWGAHDNALDNRFNEHGIGICLVGNFNKTHPTAAQRRSLLKLVTYLMRTYHIPVSRVLGHGETKDTQCPGRYLNVAEIRGTLSRMADLPADNVPSGELLTARN